MKVGETRNTQNSFGGNLRRKRLHERDKPRRKNNTELDAEEVGFEALN
jgi:hypothetical protein